jgi:hypothetical protein
VGNNRIQNSGIGIQEVEEQRTGDRAMLNCELRMVDRELLCYLCHRRLPTAYCLLQW